MEIVRFFENKFALSLLTKTMIFFNNFSYTQKKKNTIKISGYDLCMLSTMFWFVWL